MHPGKTHIHNQQQKHVQRRVLREKHTHTSSPCLEHVASSHVRKVHRQWYLTRLATQKKCYLYVKNVHQLSRSSWGKCTTILHMSSSVGYKRPFNPTGYPMFSPRLLMHNSETTWERTSTQYQNACRERHWRSGSRTCTFQSWLPFCSNRYRWIWLWLPHDTQIGRAHMSV